MARFISFTEPSPAGGSNTVYVNVEQVGSAVWDATGKTLEVSLAVTGEKFLLTGDEATAAAGVLRKLTNGA
jgi:hypothetical protein